METLTLSFAICLLLQSGHVTAGDAPLNLDNLNICRDSCHPHDCTDVNAQGLTADGVYLIYPSGVNSLPVPVYCDMTSAGGPWTVFQKRFDGSVDFYRGWKEYKDGFGIASGEYWLGLQHIHSLTQKGEYSLRIDLMDFENEARFVTYNPFSLSPLAINAEENGFEFHIGKFQEGNQKKPIRDSLRTQEKMKFSTYDNDRDTLSGNCAALFSGASWYSNCHSANLNGLYLKGNTTEYAKGMTWLGWKGHYYSLKASEMKIARNFLSH